MKQLAMLLALVLGLAIASQTISFAQEDGTGTEGEQPAEPKDDMPSDD